MILLMSSAGKETYRQFILRVLSYPKDFELTDVPYSLAWVDELFVRDPAELEDRQGLVCFIEYVPRPGNTASPVEALFLPLRLAVIKSARRFAGKLLLRLRLGNFVYYDEAAKQGCRASQPVASVLQWNGAIKALPKAPRAVPRVAGGVIDPGDSDSWRSGGKFVLEISDAALELQVPTANEALIRAQCDDWKSTIDVLAERTLLRDKLFYQIAGLRRVSGEDLPLTTRDQKSIYMVSPGENLDLVLHFYYGETGRKASRRNLEIVTASEYLSVLGSSTIEVDPEQFSGKIESVRVRAKRQLTEEFSYISIREKEPSTAALASTELYLRIRPAWWYVGTILGLFFVGTLLSGIPTDMEPPSWVPSSLTAVFTPWILKILGAGIMAIMLWSSFSKLPSKAGS